MLIIRFFTSIFMIGLMTTIGFAGDIKIDPAKLTNTVVISVGQKCDVHFEQQGNKLSAPQIIKDISQKGEIELSLDFRKEKDISLLIIRNKFEKTLRFRALARLQGSGEIFETTILPIESNMSNYESWPDPIEELVLFDFKLTDERLNESSVPKR